MSASTSHTFARTLLQEDSFRASYDNPFSFNSKEIDPEPSEASSRTPLKNKTRCEQTGNYYYGARYYDPKLSVPALSCVEGWLSVDPLAGKYPGLTPYNFSNLNPIRFVDPNGLEGYEVMEDGTIAITDIKYYQDPETQEIFSVLPGEDDPFEGEGWKELDRVSGTNQKTGAYQEEYFEKGFMSAASTADNSIGKTVLDDNGDVHRLDKGQSYWIFSYNSQSEEAFKLFLFLSETSSVEWDLTFHLKGTVSISTLHLETASSSLNINGQPASVKVHGHPFGSLYGPSDNDFHGALDGFKNNYIYDVTSGNLLEYYKDGKKRQIYTKGFREVNKLPINLR